MENPRLRVKVVHSITNLAWNVVNVGLGGKFKIAQCPYVAGDDKTSYIFKDEAYQHAQFIAYCFNNSKEILSTQK